MPTRTAKLCPVAPTLAISGADDEPGSPGRSRISRKTIAQAEPVATAACLFCCRWAAGEDPEMMHHSGAQRRENAGSHPISLFRGFAFGLEVPVTTSAGHHPRKRVFQ
jgi:hypothetical protein